MNGENKCILILTTIHVKPALLKVCFLALMTRWSEKPLKRLTEAYFAEKFETEMNITGLKTSF